MHELDMLGKDGRWNRCTLRSQRVLRRNHLDPSYRQQSLHAAIVVVENIERNIAEGRTPLAAAHQAMREVSGTLRRECRAHQAHDC